MTIKELKELYPKQKVWIAMQLQKGGKKYPCWDYNDDDEVVSYEYNALHKSVDITDAVFKGGKIKTFVKPQLKVIWKRKGQGE